MRKYTIKSYKHKYDCLLVSTYNDNKILFLQENRICLQLWRRIFLSDNYNLKIVENGTAINGFDLSKIEYFKQ